MSSSVERAGGFVHDIDKLSGLSSDPLHIRVLSDRSLYVLENISELDLTFLARYGDGFVGGEYDPVQEGTPNAGLVENVFDNARYELMNDVNEGLDAIASAITNLANAQCCNESQVIDCGAGQAGPTQDAPTEQEDDGATSPDPEQWPGYSQYQDFKCKMANRILADMDSDLARLQGLNWATITLFGALQLAAIVTATLVSPIPGDEILAIVGTIAIISGAMNPVLTAIRNVISDKEVELVCGMFNAQTASQARSSFRTIVSDELDATQGEPLATNAKVLAYIWSAFNNFNRLFDGDINQVLGSPSVTCGQCAESSDFIWDFEIDAEGWTHTDESVLGASQVGAHDVSGVLRNTCATVLTPGTGSLGTFRSLSLNATSDAGVTQFFVNLSAPSDLTNVVQRAGIRYEDATEDTNQLVTAGAAGFAVTATVSKPIDYVFWFHERGVPGGTPAFNWTADLLEASLTL